MKSTAERTWRHLDTCQFETVIKANVPSVKHRDGRIEEVAVPWADRCQRITQLQAQAVIIWLQACGNVTRVAEIMRLDWQAVYNIMKAAVERLGVKAVAMDMWAARTAQITYHYLLPHPAICLRKNLSTRRHAGMPLEWFSRHARSSSSACSGVMNRPLSRLT